MNQQLEKIETKIDKLDEKLDIVDKHLAIYNEQLTVHIKRTNILEGIVKKLNTHVHEVRGIIKFITFAATVAGLLAIILQYSGK